MMTKKSVLIVIIAALIFAAGVDQLYAGSKNRMGTAGATELLIPVGSRGTALSGAMNAYATGVDAIYWNPAGVARRTGVEAMFSHLSYIADIGVQYFAVSSNFGDVGTFAVSLRNLSFGDIPITTVFQPEGTGGTFTPTYLTFGLTYSRAFTDRIYGGATVKLVSEKIMRSTASGLAFDFGVQYRSGETGINLGVTLKNIGGGMKYDGPDLERFVNLPNVEPGSRQRPLRIVSAGFEFPTTLEIGIAYPYVINDRNKVSVMANFQNANFDADEYRFGLEYDYDNMLYLRGGYAMSQFTTDYIFGPTFGLGLNIPFGDFRLAFDYAYRVTDLFDANQWFTIQFSF